MDSDDDLKHPLPKRTRKNWTVQDEYRLLDKWSDYADELRGAKRNAHIYAKIAEEMGGKFNCQEVHTKTRNMSQRYRFEKKEGCPTKWEHFDTVQRIVESIQPGSVVESFSCENSNSSASSSKSDPLVVRYQRVLPVPVDSLKPAVQNQPISTSSNSQKRNDDYSSEILRCLIRQTEQGEEQLKILRSVAEDTRNLYANLGNYLREQQENDKTFMQVLEKLLEKDKSVN